MIYSILFFLGFISGYSCLIIYKYTLYLKATDGTGNNMEKIHGTWIQLVESPMERSQSHE